MGNRYIKTRCETSFDVLFDVNNLMYLLLTLFYDVIIICCVDCATDRRTTQKDVVSSKGCKLAS